MTDSTDTLVHPQDICYRVFELVRAKQFDAAEKLLSHWLGKTEEPVGCALLHSAYGVLEKSRGAYKSALRHYERAEKLLPTDPAIKLITAQLLIDVFKETDRAIRKCRQVEKLLPDNPVMLHHARTLEGLAYVVSGNRRKAAEQCAKSMENAFQGFLTCDNLNFLLVEMLVRKGWELELCHRFITQALALAQEHREAEWVARLTTMLDAMSVTDRAEHPDRPAS